MYSSQIFCWEGPCIQNASRDMIPKCYVYLLENHIREAGFTWMLV